MSYTADFLILVYLYLTYSNDILYQNSAKIPNNANRTKKEFRILTGLKIGSKGSESKFSRGFGKIILILNIFLPNIQQI